MSFVLVVVITCRSLCSGRWRSPCGVGLTGRVVWVGSIWCRLAFRAPTYQVDLNLFSNTGSVLRGFALDQIWVVFPSSPKGAKRVKAAKSRWADHIASALVNFKPTCIANVGYSAISSNPNVHGASSVVSPVQGMTRIELLFIINPQKD